MTARSHWDSRLALGARPSTCRTDTRRDGVFQCRFCKTYAGLDDDLYITADAEAFVKWHAGQLTWADATRDSRIHLDGPSWLVGPPPRTELQCPGEIKLQR
jgi:hypothetical protein